MEAKTGHVPKRKEKKEVGFVGMFYMQIHQSERIQ